MDKENTTPSDGSTPDTTPTNDGDSPQPESQPSRPVASPSFLGNIRNDFWDESFF